MRYWIDSGPALSDHLVLDSLDLIIITGEKMEKQPGTCDKCGISTCSTSEEKHGQALQKPYESVEPYSLSFEPVGLDKSRS